MNIDGGFRRRIQKLRSLRCHFQIIIITVIKAVSVFSLSAFVHLFIFACVSSYLQVRQLDALTEEVKPNWYENNIIDRM